MDKERPSTIPLDDLIHDWNGHAPLARLATAATFCDETLRDGLQNPSVVDPPVHRKIELLHLMDSIGVSVANIGLPGVSRRAYEHALRLSREVVDAGLSLRTCAAGRTLPADVKPILDIAHRTGLPVEVYLFIGSSPIRQLAEEWDEDLLVLRSKQTIEMVVREGLPVAFVAEDATRSRPDALARLFKNAFDCGARRVCLADTVGHATPSGVEALVRFTREVLASVGGTDVGIDWHGHNDRGLALANALHALSCGADRLHGTALGIGERVGNAPMELILVNLKLAGQLGDQDLRELSEYCHKAAAMVGWTVPPNYPVVGRDAFRTATGVHASAIMKAARKEREGLEDRMFSSVPASWFGRSQEIEIGFMSGASNVLHWLKQHGEPATRELVDAILVAAKDGDHTMSDHEVKSLVRGLKAKASKGRAPQP